MAATKKKRQPRKPSKKKLAEKAAEFFSSVEPTAEYIKHLITCRCSLPQYRTWDEPPDHKFVVFSELDETGDVKQSYAQCNHCGIIHKVLEIGRSMTLKKEEMRSLTTIDDLEGQMPRWLAGLLRKHECELHTWQEAQFIYTNELWGRFIILAKEREDDVVIGKLCQILGQNLHKIENFERDEGLV